MADGLFFTGTVFKNNRNLIQEENSRKQLAMQEESLNMKKEDAAAKRKKARQDQAESYQEDADLSGINDPRLAKALSNKAEEVNKFAADNYENQDDPTFRAELKAKRAEVQLFGKYLTKLDSTITTYNPLNEDAQNLRYKSDDDGNNLFELNLNNEIASFEDGTFDLNANIASFSDRYDKTIIRDMPTPDYITDLDNFETTYVDQTTGETKKGLPPNARDAFIGNFENNYSINATTKDFVGKSQEDAYFNTSFNVNGDAMTGIELYLKEVEGTPNVEGVYESYTDRFDPRSELFDEALHFKYVKFLGEKIYEKESKARTQILSKPEKNGKKPGYTEEMKSIVETKEYTPGEVYGEVTLKKEVFSPIKSVEVNITPEMLVPGQDEKAVEALKEEHLSYTGEGEKATIPGNIVAIATTSDNYPVAKVEAFGKVFLLDLKPFYTQVKDAKVAEDGVGLAILESALGAVTDTEAATPTSTKAPR